MLKNCHLRQNELVKIFLSCKDKRSVYEKIIELGKLLPSPSPEDLIEENLVPGCQSKLYLISSEVDGKIFFTASSDALISAGLAYLLLYIYNGQTPETILKCPPNFINEIGLLSSLTPGRSNGFNSLLLKIKRESINFLAK